MGVDVNKQTDLANTALQDAPQNNSRETPPNWIREWIST